MVQDTSAVPMEGIRCGSATYSLAGHASFRIEDGATQIYIDPWKLPSNAPKADFVPEMKGGVTDFALLPVGGTYTMSAREAAVAQTH